MELKELLVLLNEWWKTGNVAKDRLQEYKRESFEEIKELLSYRQITIISGLRRVGKSTIMFQLIDFLLKHKGIDPKQIVYFSYDEKKYEIVDILEAFQAITETNWKEKKIYVFLDEIQKLKDWSSKIKLIYDNFPNIKFVISGSASLQLEKEAMYNLAGRYFIKEIPPLSLKEYFELKHKIRISNYQLYKNDLKRELEEWFKKPFPEIVSFKEERRIYEYIKESIISKILKIDLPDIFNNINTKLLETLLNIFYSEPGMILNIDSLSKDLKVHKKTLEQHIFLLEFSKLIRIVKNYRVSVLAESRKLRKVYPYHIALVFPFSTPEKSKILETTVASKIDAKYYWREGKKEIDFIVKDREILPIEVKAKANLHKEDFDNLNYFIKKFKNKVGKGVIIYEGETKKDKIILANILDFLYGTFI
jgi:predicted AAA+ superfamily ATPase